MNPILALCLICSLAPARAAQEVAVAPIDLAVERLEQLAEDHPVPGMALAVVTSEGAFTRGIGTTDRETAAVTAQTCFEIGSTTKTFTAVLCALLREEGMLDFDDHVRDHVEYFRLKDSAADAAVSLRDLLSHRTGLTRNDLLLGGGDQLKPEEIIRQLALAEPMAPFRQAFLYNNQMFLVAGTACEFASGSSYEELLGEYLFEPLGMARSYTFFTDAEEFHDGYRWIEDEQRFVAEPTRGIRLCAPAGSIVSCAEDMARYVAFLLGRGTTVEGDELLDSSVFEDDLWEEQISLGGPAGYGLGFMLGEWRGRRLVTHGGNVDGFTSQMALLPDEGVGFSLLMNVSLSPVQELSLDAVFSAILAESFGDEGVGEVGEAGELGETQLGVPFAPAELDAFVGEYELAAASQIWTVQVNDSGKLALDVPGQTVYELEWPDEGGKWAFAVAPQVQVSFTREGGAPPHALTLYQGGAEVELPRRVAAQGLPSVEEVLGWLDGALPADAIAAATPLEFRGTVHFIHQGVEGELRLRWQDETHWRQDLDFGKFGHIVTAVDGNSGWVDTGHAGRRDLSPSEVDQAIVSAPFARLSQMGEKLESREVVASEGEGEERRVRLRLTPRYGEPATYHVDPAGRVHRVDSAIGLGELGSVPVRTDLSDYREIDGLLLPFRSASENVMNGRAEIQFESLTKQIEWEDRWLEEL